MQAISMNENKTNSDPMENQKKNSPPEKNEQVIKDSQATESKNQDSKVDEPKMSDPKAHEQKAAGAEGPKPSHSGKEDSNAVSSQAKPIAKKSSSGLAGLALLVSLAAAGGAGYNWYQANMLSTDDKDQTATALASITEQQVSLDQKLTTIESSNTQFTSSLSEVKESTANIESNLNSQLEAQLQTFKGDLDKQVSVISNDVLAVSDEMNAISMQMSQGLNHVKLLEVLELVSRADQYIQIDQSVDQAINALTAAQASLQKVTGFNKRPLEQSLNQQLQQLQSIDQNIRSNAATQLIAMVNSVDQLPLYQEPKEQKVDVPVEKVEEPQVEAVTTQSENKNQSWYQSFSQDIGGKINKIGSELVSDLSGMVTVQDKSDPAVKGQEQSKALYVPKDQFYLKQNLKLSLLSAQNALIQKENAVYLENLQLAKQWLVQYFDAQAAPVSANIATIDSLLQIDLEPVTVEMSQLISEIERQLSQQQTSIHKAKNSFDDLVSQSNGNDFHQLDENDIKDILNDLEEYTRSEQPNDFNADTAQNHKIIDTINTVR